MHDDAALVERRIRRELNERVMPAMYSASVPMQVVAWDAPGEPVGYREAMAGLATDGRSFTIGSHWSRPWGTTWFRFTADVPADWSGTNLEAVIDLGYVERGEITLEQLDTALDLLSMTHPGVAK